jgi:hypothetical protein
MTGLRTKCSEGPDGKPFSKFTRGLGRYTTADQLTVGVKSSPPEGWKYEDRIIQTDGTQVVTEDIMITPEGTLRGKIVKGFNPNDPMISTRIEPLVKSEELDDL